MMFWKRGWLVDSLRYRVETIIRNTLYQNETFLNNRRSRIDRLLVWGSKHIVIANCILFAIAVLIPISSPVWYDSLKQNISTSIGGLESILEIQPIIFGAQITLLGLIFPLVIAFIGILLQGKSSNQSMWVVYRRNSGFMLVGFSALVLSAFFILFKLVEPWLMHQQVVATSISITLWFLINLILSGRFIWQTVQFLSLNQRMEMVVKYAINDVIANDLRKRLLLHIHNNVMASEYNEYTITDVSMDDNRSQVSHQFSKPKLVNNVWYRFLNVGIWIWVVQGCLSKSRNNKTALCLPFAVDGNKQKNMVLAKTDKGRINFVSAFFIRQAVRTTAKHKSRLLGIKQMMGALFGQIEDALTDNNSRLFDSATVSLVQFHREIESSMRFINDEKKPDNWFLLPEPPWLSRIFLDVFIRESIGISKKITRIMRDDANYYETWCYFYIKLFNPKDSGVSAKVAKAYIDGHYFIWGELMSWMGGFGSGSSTEDPQRDRAIKHFVGSWEYWRNLLNPNFSSVDELDFGCATRHLANTSCMLVHATKYENFDAASWATDVLVHWYELFSNHNHGYHHHQWHHELITPPLLKLADDHALRRTIFDSDNTNFIESEASLIALRNHWTDIRCLTAAYLMGSPKYGVSERYRVCIKQYIAALLDCTRLEPTGNVEINQAQLLNPEDVLGVYLRQRDYWGDERIYTEGLEYHLDRLASIEEPEWVSGRIYSSSGTKIGRYLPIFYKVIGIGLTKAKFELDVKWMKFLKSEEAVSPRVLENLVSGLQKLTSIDDQIIKLVCHQFDIERGDAESKRDLFVESINDIVTNLKENIESQIIDAPVDKERLKTFGDFASKSTFTLEEGPIPISLFQDIEYIDDFILGSVKQDIINYKKSEVSEGLDVNRPINNKEHIHNIVEQLATVTSFNQIFDKLSWKVRESEDALTLISRAVKDSELIKKSSQTPVMFVGPWSLLQLIQESTSRYGKEEDKLPFDIRVESEKSNSYVCHLSGIEIYRILSIPCNFSVMLPIEALKKISVKRFENGRYVDVDFTTKSNTDLIGTLSISFGIECDIQAEECFKYISIEPDE